MTESDWLKAANPDAMLRLVADRLSARRWHLLACAVTRRVWDALPDGPFRQAVEWAETHAGELPAHPYAAAKFRDLEAASGATTAAAREAQRQIVLPADPDADPNSFEAAARKPNPTTPLFRAACTHAVSAVEEAEQAAEQAVRAVGALLTEMPGFALVDRLRGAVVEATRLRTSASTHAAVALDLKARGDDAADRNTGKKVNFQIAASEETVRRLDEQTGYKIADLEDAKQKADKKALGRFLHELVGNPFRPYRFEPAWRTEAVLGVARGIDADRAFDRMPVLADALLDADCDEEAILRHCRGTEAHTPDGPHHIRGCWVIDLILEREPALFAAPTLSPPPPPPPPPPARRPPGRGTPPSGGGGSDSANMLKLLEALRRTPPPSKDDDE